MMGSLAAFSFGCSDGIVPTPVASGGVGAGGTVATGGQPETGGTVGSGGRISSGGDSGTGGQNRTGGAPSSGGVTVASGGTTGTGTGGVTSSGGVTVASGGTPSSGGVTIASGGRSGRGGASGTGTGGATGGASATGGGPTGGSTGPIGTTKKFVGNIDTSGSIRSDFSKYWNQFSPENAGKWGSAQGSSQSSFNWNSLDAMYKYCNDNHIIFKQHNFIWGSQQPSWTSSLTTSTGPAAVQNWMTSFCTRYPNVAIIDVVNEPPPHTTPSYANAIGGGTNGTWQWIANAFIWARAACPNALLVLNDYNNDEQSGDAQHSIDIVTAIKKLNAPIDGVGCQTHGAMGKTGASLKTNIDKIASGTGLGVYITEYDINSADDNTQLSNYKDHFTMFMSNDNVKGATVWGYVVGRTWETNSGIMNSDGTLRPAMTWLMSFLGR
jgi:endo-1,4-beta-xylanase